VRRPSRLSGLQALVAALVATAVLPLLGTLPEARAAVPVTNEVLVVAAVRQGGSILHPDAMDRTAETVNTSVHDYWAEQSNGAIEVHATAWPTYVTTQANCGDIQAVYAEVAAAVGFQPGAGKHLLVFGSGLGENLPNCLYKDADLGSSRTSGGRSYVRDWATAAVARALGRNFGLAEAAAEQCVGGIHTGQCRTEPGGDWYDLMGGNVNNPLGSLSGPQAARLGVLPADQLVTFSDAAEPIRTVSLQPVGVRTGVRALRLPGTSEDVWLEYRAATGRDAWLGSQTIAPVLQTGVIARLSRASDPTTTLLLDPTPTATPWPGGATWEDTRQVALPVGQPIDVNGYTITVQSISAGQARVQVQHGFGVLRGGSQLSSGEAYFSPPPSYKLAQQPDGNLVASSPDGRVLWNSGTWGRPGARTVMQPDGNLVMYATDGRAIWWTGTWGNPDARLYIQYDGNLVLYSVDGRPLWWTGADLRSTLGSGGQLLAGMALTSPDGRYRAVSQMDGNLVVYGPLNRVIWASYRYANQARVRMQADGNVVSYAPDGRAIWWSGTWSNPGARLVMQNDGNLVVYRSNGTPAWWTGSDPAR
jgi:hypothetical protein